MRARRWVCAAASISLLLTACDAPTAPREEQDVYDFSFPDGRVFRWPSGSIIRVYADVETHPERAALLGSSLALAVGLWNAAAEHGEYELRVVERPEDAQVMVSWFGAPPPLSPEGCDGVPPGTFIGLNAWCRVSEGRLKPYRFADGAQSGVRMLVRVGGVEPENEALVRKTVVHELGHVLGLVAHSPRAGDVMASDRGPAELSLRDRNTIARLYETPPDFEP